LNLKKRLETGKDEYAKRIIEAYLNDTRNELFESREELISHYSKQENYQKLLDGSEGKNLTHSYRAICLLNSEQWSDFVTQSFESYILSKYTENENREIVTAISKNIKVQAQCQSRYFSRHSDIPSRKKPLKIKLEYDIPGLFAKKIHRSNGTSLNKESVMYSYFMSDDAIKFITSLPEELKILDLGLAILRMHQSYIFPARLKEDKAPIA